CRKSNRKVARHLTYEPFLKVELIYGWQNQFTRPPGASDADRLSAGVAAERGGVRHHLPGAGQPELGTHFLLAGRSRRDQRDRRGRFWVCRLARAAERNTGETARRLASARE